MEMKDMEEAIAEKKTGGPGVQFVSVSDA